MVTHTKSALIEVKLPRRVLGDELREAAKSIAGANYRDKFVAAPSAYIFGQSSSLVCEHLIVATSEAMPAIQLDHLYDSVVIMTYSWAEARIFARNYSQADYDQAVSRFATALVEYLTV
jgi:hypothetical protein